MTLWIWRKDSRRFRIEILISLLTLVALTGTEWWICTPAGQIHHWYTNVAPLVLLALSWWVLVVRVVQEDGLVADREFWKTRPIAWYELLGGKVLFALTWVILPLTVSQVVLVVADGGPLMLALGNILVTTTVAGVLGLLPFAAIATVTRGLSQWLLVTFGALLALGSAMTWIESHSRDSHVSIGMDVSGIAQAVVFTALAGAGICIQYAWRKRVVAAVCIGAGMVAVPITDWSTPYRMLIRQTFPLVRAGEIPVGIKILQPDKPDRLSDLSASMIDLGFPVRVEELPEDMLLKLEGVMLEIDLPDGRKWESEWVPGRESVLWQGRRAVAGVPVNANVFKMIGDAPTGVRLSMAFSELRDEKRQRFNQRQFFDIAGVGACWTPMNGYVTCRTVQNQWPYLMTTSICTDGVTRDLNSDSAEGPLSPLNLRRFYNTSRHNETCAQAELTMSAPQLERRFRLETALGRLRLRDWEDHPGISF